jgi:hypothetical protein
VTKLFISNLNQRDGSCLPPRGVTCVTFPNILNLIRSLPSVYNKLKNDLRLPLTNTVKELEEILDFGLQTDKIDHFINLDCSGSTKTKKHDGCLDSAMRIDSFNSCERLETFGSVRMKAQNEKCSHKNWKMRKSRLNSVWLVKRKLLKRL